MTAVDFDRIGGGPEHNHAPGQFIQQPLLGLYRLKAKEQSGVGEPECFCGEVQAAASRHQVCQSVDHVRGHRDLRLYVRRRCFGLRFPDPSLQVLLMGLQLVERAGDGLELLRRLGESHVAGNRPQL
ncbi:MAG: hypothetical protein GXY83_18450 [Rhodopirellula sp.]|nr:hypothetical protein [Rhodopirellula sp.]